MTQDYAAIFTPTSVVVNVDNTQHVIEQSHLNFEKVRQAIRDGAPGKDIVALVDLPKAIQDWFGRRITIRGGTIYRTGVHGAEPLHHTLVDRIFKMLDEGFDATPMIKFLDNLLANPAKRAVDELYLFLEHNGIPITPDGHFLAYKKVRDNYRDQYSGRFDNSVGKVVMMDRNSVDEDRHRTCSAGLHFCAKHYLGSYGWGRGNRVMIVKINPADVVAIPSDYNNAKGRTWRYVVVGEDTTGGAGALDTGKVVNEDYDDYDAGYDDGYKDALNDYDVEV